MAAPYCENPSDFRKKHGVGENFVKSVRKNITEMSEKNVKDNMRALARNLGLDDARAVKLKDGKKHFFGRNLKDIEEFDAYKGKNVPKDTIVSLKNQDGSTDYYIANQATSQAPETWVVSNKSVKPHPHWSKLGQNVTVDENGSLKRFRRNDDGTFTEDAQGQTILNIQKPYDGTDSPKYKLAAEGYDAYKVDGKTYKPFDEFTQAKNPETAFIEPENGNAVSTRTSKINPEEIDEMEIAEQLKTFGIGNKLATTLAGYTAGEIADNFTEDDSGAWIGGALGFLMGSSRVRNAVKGLATGKNFDKIAKDFASAQEDYARYWDEVQGGYRGSPQNKALRNEYKDKFLNSYTALKQMGKSVKDFLFDNDFIKSGWSRLRDMGSKTADQMLKIFMGAEAAHTSLRSEYGKVLEKYFGRDASIEGFKQARLKVMRDYINSLSDSSVYQNYSEQDLLEEIGASLNRIITHRAQIKNGEMTWDTESIAANRAYDSDVVREKDRFVLQSEEGQRIINVTRETFDRMGEATDRVLEEAMNRLRENDMVGEVRRVFDDFKESGMTYKQWKQNFDEDMDELYKKHQNNEILQEAIDYRGKQLKIRALKGRYIPQVMSTEKLMRVKRRFLQRAEVQKLDEAGREEAWAEYVNSRILEMNAGDKALKQIDESGDNIENIYFKTRDDALQQLRDHYVHRITDPDVRNRVLNDLETGDPSTIRQYFGEKYFPNRTRPKTFIKNPEYLDYDILRDMNQETIGSARKTYMNWVTYKQSDHLDNPRNYVLPTNMLVNDVEELVNRYSRDVGLRLHWIDNGIGTKSALDRTIRQVKNELKDKGVDATNIEDEVKKIESWYSNLNRTSDFIEVDMTDSQRLRRYRAKQRNNKLIKTAMNFSYMPFLWFTPFYAMFTPAILTPYFARYGKLGKSYKEVFSNPQALKSVTDEMYKRGVIEKKVASYNPEMQGHYSQDALSGTDASLIDHLYNLSERGVNFSSRFSLTKKIIDGFNLATGKNVDLENAGLLRMGGGDLFDISGAESGLVSMAVLREIEELTEAAEWMMKKPADMKGKVNVEDIKKRVGREGEPQMTIPEQGAVVELNGHTFRWNSVREQLESFGIDDITRFVEESRRVNNKTVGESNITSFRRKIEGDKEQYNEVSTYLDHQYSRIMDNIVSHYHGRTKITRPLYWTNNPYGRLLSQFSSYSKNFGVQTVRKRMYQPIVDWSRKYKMNNENASMFKTMWYLRTENYDKLKEMFGDNWEQAMNDFPVDAFNNIFKVTPIAMGVGVTMNMSRDAVMDAINLIGNEAIANDDYEAWENTRENLKYGKQLMGGGREGFEIAKMASAFAHNAVEMGYGGRSAQIFVNNARYNEGNIWSRTPATQAVADMLEIPNQAYQGESFSEKARNVSKETLSFMAMRTPIIGTFHGFREGLVNSVFNKPKNKDVTFKDAETGIEIDDLESPMD